MFTNNVRRNYYLFLKSSKFCLLESLFIMPFYAVASGRSVGIYNTWGECESQVKGFSGARYKKFNTASEAQDFIDQNSNSKISSKGNYSKGIEGNYSKETYLSKTVDTITNKTDSLKRLEAEKACHDITKRMNDIQNGINHIKQFTSGKRTLMIDAPVNAKKIKKEQGFDIDDDGYLQAWTDGACSSNGKNCAKAGLGVYFGPSHPSNVSQPVSGRATNNCGEIQAATEALKIARINGHQKICINTDSKFLIDSVTKWMNGELSFPFLGWKRRNWTLKDGGPVKNTEDFKKLDEAQKGLDVKWNYVEAHKGIHGNEMADMLAKQGAEKYRS